MKIEKKAFEFFEPNILELADVYHECQSRVPNVAFIHKSSDFEAFAWVRGFNTISIETAVDR